MSEEEKKEETGRKPEATGPEPAKPAESREEPPKEPTIHVAPSPHLSDRGFTTRRMMVDVLIGLAPVTIAAHLFFGWHATWQIGLCLLSCLFFESLFAAFRGKKTPVSDGSIAVTGLILALSLPWSSPWYVTVIASGVAVGMGKAVFGGLGHNIFNPAMVGRAFVMISFAGALGAGGYVMLDAPPGWLADVMSQATPMTDGKAGKDVAGVFPLLIGEVNGSLGETSALACILGGLYLCIRRTASWEIPAGMILASAVIAGIADLAGGSGSLTTLHHLFGGALLFGGFFIATDPVTSPLTPKGKWIFGIGVGVSLMLLRLFSAYPEGVMFAVLLMNSVTPLINRWTVPTPVGGPVPVRK